jgi:hypothetical protein
MIRAAKTKRLQSVYQFPDILRLAAGEGTRVTASAPTCRRLLTLSFPKIKSLLFAHIVFVAQHYITL